MPRAAFTGLALRFPNLLVLPWKTFDSVSDFEEQRLGRQLANCCPKIINVSSIFFQSKRLFMEYNLAHGHSELKSLTISVRRDKYFDWSKLLTAVEMSQLSELGVVQKRSSSKPVNAELRHFIDFVAPRITKLFVLWTDAVVQHFNKFSNLVELDYSAGDSKVTTHSRFVPNLPKLKKLHLGSHPGKNADFRHLSGLTTICLGAYLLLTGFRRLSRTISRHLRS